jgi:hypothetical protein
VEEGLQPAERQAVVMTNRVRIGNVFQTAANGRNSGFAVIA